MNLFLILLAGGLVSPLIKNFQFQKLFAIFTLAVGSFFISTGNIQLFQIIVLLVFGAIIISLHDEQKNTITQSLFLASASTLFLEASTILEFVILFEALSIISFVLAAQIKDKEEAEGAIKLFVAGALSSGIILLGLALFTLSGADINATILEQSSMLGTVSIFIMLSAVMYKLTIVPMHAWAADSYAKIDHSSAAILSGVIKTVVAVGAFNIFLPALQDIGTISVYILATLSVITMTLGNFLALHQKRISSILAYSSIAHAGYMLLTFASVSSEFAPNGLLYLAVAYIFMQSAVFVILNDLKRGDNIETISDLKGLSKRNPLYSLIFTLQLFSLAGIPLLAGFLSKTVAFYSAVDAGLWIVVLGALLNSALSVGYYAWIIKHIYFDENQKQETVKISYSANIAQFILLCGTLYFGMFAADIFLF